MKRTAAIFICLILMSNSLFPQDSVKVTFRHYPMQENIVLASVPGTFNNWGSHNNGYIDPNNPAVMTYIDSLESYVKTIKLRVGDTHNYKFNEQNSNQDISWITDPNNPLVNTSDNNNSILNVKNLMIFQLLPRNGVVLTELQPKIVAGIFVSDSDSLLESQSAIILDGNVLTTFEGHMISELSLLNYQTPVLSGGEHTIIIQAKTKNDNSISDTISVTIQSQSTEIVELPDGVIDGINYIDETTVTLSLYAPNKEFVYVIGDFNDWQANSEYLMKMTPDSNRFWLTISDLEYQKEYIFQYIVDGEIRIADPYTEKVSDPWNDQYISEITYPNLLSYPEGKTSEIASVLQTGQEAYDWEVEDFQRPEKEDLVIYEMLVRDFLEEHDFKTLADTLSYFQKLGVTAIEIMPFNEFEGNISWGYNPSFYFAPDKYYGPEEDLKYFIDEAHKYGIAVIMDIVLNHAYGQCPLVRLYQGDMSKNPWFNVTSPNPVYAWGFDFNHESEATKAFIDRVNAYWVQEYQIDGFRFDFTKGFTNKPGDGWSRDDSRIAILKRMADKIWEADSTVYVILEHFTENSEEKELANYGMMVWGNMNTAYSQSAMGWLSDSERPSDLSPVYFKNRGWTKPHLVSYMESHDEPWLMYKNLQYGNSYNDYNIKDLSTALDRIKLVSTFFLTIPGPKMLWQFGELGYDQYLPESGSERTASKPILWNYYQEFERKRLFKTVAALIKLRRENDVFTNPESQVDMHVGQNQAGRRINISDDYMFVTIIGNFGVTPLEINPDFQNTGEWFDYFSGDTLHVSDTGASLDLEPGEFRIYTNLKLETPDIPTGVEINDIETAMSFDLKQNYPNPFNPETVIRYTLPQLSDVRIVIYNMLGQEIKILVNQPQLAGSYHVAWDGTDNLGRTVSSGLYIYRMEANNSVKLRKMMLIR